MSNTSSSLACRLAGVVSAFICGLAVGEVPIFEDGFETRPLTVIAIDPPLASQASGLLAQVHVDRLNSPPQAVTIRGPGGQEIAATFLFDPDFPGGFGLTIPPGLETGEWALEVQPAGDGDAATLASAFMVTDTVDLAFESAPTYMAAAEGGTLRLTSENVFTALPQVLLRPSPADAQTVATPLQGIEFASPAELLALVPPGLTAGSYDVIVLNPDGSSGILPAGLSLSDQAAPRIHAVSPTALAYGAPSEITVSGAGFNTNSVANLVCEDGNSANLTTVPTNESELALQYDASLLQATICIIVVQNPDGQSTAWSGIRFQGFSDRFGAPVLASSMTQARRAPALAMARLSGTRQRVYAIGGDDGSAANALSSVEFTDVSPFGATSPWRAAASELPEPRSFAWAAQYGQFLYLAGGFDGTDEANTVYRAQILSSDTSPVIKRHRLSITPGAQGFSSSVQAYRVAPVFPADDPGNPSGTGAAGPVFIARVPAVADVSASLQWPAVPGAVAYQLFTQPPGSSWDGNPGSLELLAVTSSTSYVNGGDGSTDPGTRPLEEGETGRWHTISDWNLGTARSRAAGALSPLPGRPNDIALYLFGGVDGSGVTLDSYTYSLISSAESATPSYGDWLAGAEGLSVAVHNPVAWPVSASNDDNHWIFVGSGWSGAASPQKFIDRGSVAETGGLGTFVSMSSALPNPGSAGAIALTAPGSPVSSNGYLGITAGAAGNASGTVRDAEIVSGPEPSSWNATPNGLQQARIYAGSATGGPFIFIAGGSDGDGLALSSVERLIR